MRLKRIFYFSLITIVVGLFLCGCVAYQQPAKDPYVALRSHEARIQYYKEQISHYQYLIEQEQRKIAGQ